MKESLHSTQLLRADQHDLLLKLDVLQRALGGLAIDAPSGPAEMMPVVEELGEFFRTGIWTLVWKEEDALFPAVQPYVPRGEDAIAHMRHDHAELRKANDHFQSAISAYRAGKGNGESMAAVRESGARIIALLREHIPAEDQALLVVADANLDRAQDQRMLDTFGAIEADLAWAFENLQEFYP